jgi:hypothetical protein
MSVLVLLLTQVQLQSLFKGMPQLTSLKVVGGTGAVLDPAKDLPIAAQHLTALQSLSYTGKHRLPFPAPAMHMPWS